MQATPFSDDPLERPLQANLAPILGAEVGRGGMGRVLAASDPALDRRFAVKVIHDGDRGTVADRRRTRRLVREARLLAGLQHPGVVPVFELGVTADRRPYYSMPLIEGLDLDAILTRHRSGDAAWPRNRLLEILAQVCDTVAYAHDRGVIHRDLKPANLMVADSGAVYVMDWGL
ncbi:MAG: serine/threonine protein kinase, partial [Planctomycetes bacterium]|nr:serine/threonine protein kinase [Planctomycetota bacterium]